MKYVLNIVNDIEETLIKEISLYFFKEVRFKKLYPNFGDIRISGTHPFAFLVDQMVNQTKIPVGLFPSITIIDDSDSKNSDVPITTPVIDVTIGSDEINDIEENRNDYSISDEDLIILKDLTSSNNKLYAQGVETYKRANMVTEVWSENPKIKNKIYDLLSGFLLGLKRFSIKEVYGIIIDENSISGEKSGVYNYDFGKIIYGGMIRFVVDFSARQYIIDTDSQVTLTGIQHSIKEIHHEGN